MREPWDEHFLSLAKLIGARSKDTSTQIGCIIIRGRDIVSTGYNGFPRGVDDTPPERHERPIKYMFVSHAEENAILNALRNGTSVVGCTLYIPKWLPCATCARLIIQSGISEVVTGEMIIPERWAESFNIGLTMMNEAGVRVREYERL